ELRRVVWSQRIAFMMIQPIAIGRHAGHEHIALDVVSQGANSGFDVSRSSAAFPVVDVIEGQFETASCQGGAQGVRVVAVGHDVFYATAEIVFWAAVQNRNAVTSLQQFSHQQPADESCSSDDEGFHATHRGRDRNSVVILEAEMSD